MTSEESRFMEPLQLAGRIIMENGGETYRVEETITRMGQAFGLSGVESFAIPSGLFISYRKTDGDNETSILRVHRGETNLSRVDGVNSISRKLVAGELDCDGALAQLRALQHMPSPVRRWWLVPAAAFSSAGFTVMFGGGWIDLLISAVVTALMQLVVMGLSRFRMSALVSTLAGSLLATLLPLVFHHLTGLGLTEAIIAGALMPMLPGLAMTNAVQDSLRGDMVSGISSGLSAVVTAGLVAGGALAANALFFLIAGGAL